jgi:hypothetical protein
MATDPADIPLVMFHQAVEQRFVRSAPHRLELDGLDLTTPPATETHIPIPHAAVVETLVETLSHRQIAVVGEEFAVACAYSILSVRQRHSAQ